MKNSSSRNFNGMKVENNSTENLRNATVTCSRNDSSLAVEKMVDMSKPKRHSAGKASVSRDNGDRKQTGNESSKLTYTSEDGIHYEPGDCVYIDSQRPDVPFFICSVKEFRMSKKDNLIVVVRWYYRPSEVPDSVYQLLVQDRNHEHGSRDHILGDEAVKERELFISDATDVYPAVALKGKCKVRPFSDVCQSLKEFITNTDCFFYVLGYNPETRRLANTKGEIRVGPSHQASIPDCIIQKGLKTLCANGSFEAKEKLVWCPQMEDCELKLYLDAARSIAHIAGTCNGGTSEDGFRAIQQDATTSNAFSVLHESGYDTGRALETLVKRPYPKVIWSKWTEDDSKKFVKGLRQFGKNFFKIKKELLPHKETSELVEYYYRWKKTQSALSSRPHRRRRHNVLKRKVHTRGTRTPSNVYIDLSSCSENDSDSEDSERDMRLYCCRHCFTDKSKSWHHGGQDKVILCVECRLFYKKYGKLPNIEEPRDPPSFMFKSTAGMDLREEESLYYLNSKHGLRSRRGAANAQSTLRSGKLKSSSPVEGLALRESQINGRRLGVKLSKPASPSSGSTSSSISTSSVTSKEKKKGKSKKTKQGKRIRDQSPDSQNGAKRKRPSEQVVQESEDEAEDSCDTNSTLGGRDSVTLPENDASSVCSNSSSNNDDRCNNRTPSPALPLVDTLPAKRFARVIPSEDGRSCTRTDCVFIYQKPPPSAPTRESSRTTASASNETGVKTEASESSERNPRPNSRKTPDEKPATITSHYESLRNMFESGGYSMFSPHIPVLSSPGGAIPIPAGISSSPGDYRMMPMHMYPGAAAAMFSARDSRENAAKYAEGFEQWYAPFRAQMQSGQHAALPFLSASAMEPNNVATRGLPSSAHEALMNRVQGRGITLDPMTGLPVQFPGQHHSHSHLHTHFHMYPHEQLRALQAQGIDPAYLQAHPELLAWRNPAAVWPPEALMHLHGNGSRGMVSPEELSAHSPIHGLGSTPLDRQLQQQLFLSQQSKYHQQALQQQQQQLLLDYEAHMRHFRRHHELQMKQRLEEASLNERYLAMHGKEQRNLQSPSQLENVVKKSLDSSGAYTSSSKRPIMIELNDD